MSRLRCLGIHRLSPDNYRFRRPQRKSCTRQIVGRLRNPPYQFETPCWQMQSDGEDNRFRAKTRLSDFQSLFCMIPSRHKSPQSHPCAFERWSILRHQLSCHTALERVLLHQGKPSTHRQFWNQFDNNLDSSWPGNLETTKKNKNALTIAKIIYSASLSLSL